jgi:hypothetical protein
MLSEKCNAFLRPLKKKAFKEERGTTIGLYAIGTSTTLESNKSLTGFWHGRITRSQLVHDP